VSLVTAVGVFWFQVSFVGNPFVLLLGTPLYLLSTLALGLLIPTLCATQQQAFATNFFVLNPFLFSRALAFRYRACPLCCNGLRI
jgi:ABC-2 type transport system permease protein